MADIIDLFTNNGMGVACLVFMMYYVNKIGKENNNILVELKAILTELTQRVNTIENKIIERKEE